MNKQSIAARDLLLDLERTIGLEDRKPTLTIVKGKDGDIAADAKSEEVQTSKSRLDELSLEQVLQNANDNTLFLDVTEREQKLFEVEMAYRLYQLVRTVEPEQLDRISEITGIDKETFQRWIGNKSIPRVLQSYLTSIVPQTEEEREAFVYMLGVVGRYTNCPGSRHYQMQLTLSDKGSGERIAENIEKLVGRKPIIKGDRFFFSDTRRIRLWRYVFENLFDNYITSDRDRVTFLQGFFDASNITLQEQGRKLVYIISVSDDRKKGKIAKTLFELGIYAGTSSHGKMVIGEYDDLNRFYELKLDKDHGTRRKVSAEIRASTPNVYSSEQYYGMRRYVRELLERGDELNGAAIARQFGVERDKNIVKKWCNDILTEFGVDVGRNKPAAPKRIKRYETLIGDLELSNVYLFEESVFRNGKLFIPVNGELYFVDTDVQKQYLNEVRSERNKVTSDDVTVLERELRAKIGRDDSGSSLELKIEQDGEFHRIVSIKNRLQYLPQTDEERLAFAYLLGAMSGNTRKSNGNKTTVYRKISSTGGNERFSHAVEVITGKKPKSSSSSKRKLCIHDRRFARTIEATLTHDFAHYLNLEQERMAFLRGFFDVTEHSFLADNGRLKYVICVRNEYAATALVRALFEEGIFPNIKESNGRRKHETYYELTIQGVNTLRRLEELNLLTRLKETRRLTKYLEERNTPSPTIAQFYAVEKALHSGDYTTKAELARRIGVSSTSLNNWSGAGRVPAVVSNYEACCKYLGVENIYYADEPVRRHDKIFFPVNGDVYELCGAMQEKYLGIYEPVDEDGEPLKVIDDDSIAHFWDELKANLACPESDEYKRSDLEITIGDKFKIMKIDERKNNGRKDDGDMGNVTKGNSSGNNALEMMYLYC